MGQVFQLLSQTTLATVRHMTAALKNGFFTLYIVFSPWSHAQLAWGSWKILKSIFQDIQRLPNALKSICVFNRKQREKPVAAGRKTTHRQNNQCSVRTNTSVNSQLKCC